MKNIEFQFSVVIHNEAKTFEINLPYEDGLVYGGQFCPYDLHPQTATEKPFHWYRAEDFVAICDNQLRITSDTLTSKHLTDALSETVIQVVRETIDKHGYITLGRLIAELDCLCEIQNSLGKRQSEIEKNYHNLAMYLIDCFPKQCVYGNPPTAIKGSPIFTKFEFR